MLPAQVRLCLRSSRGSDGGWFWFTNWKRAAATRLAERNEAVSTGTVGDQNTSRGKTPGEPTPTRRAAASKMVMYSPESTVWRGGKEHTSQGRWQTAEFSSPEHEAVLPPHPCQIAALYQVSSRL